MKTRKLGVALVTAMLLGTVTMPAMAGGGYHGYYRGGWHGHYSGGDVGFALATGLIFGGLMGYAISEDAHRAPPPRAVYYPAPAYTYEPGYTYAPPAPAYNPAPPPAYSQAPMYAEPAGCLQTREYTTTIVIDGKSKDAYGTRCLRADGTWVLGPPKLVPQF